MKNKQKQLKSKEKTNRCYCKLKQGKNLVAITNKYDDHKDHYQETFEELVKERFDKIKELTNGKNENDLTFYFKGNTARERYDDYNNAIKLFEKIKYGEMKLKEAKKLQNVFKSNLHEISKRRYKSEEQNSALENIKFLCESSEVVL